MLMDNFKDTVDKLYEEINAPDKVDYDKIQLIVLGESEGASIHDKVLVAITAINREKSKHLGFRPLEVDFHGYIRDMRIDNQKTRQQFEDSVVAVFIARKMLKKYPELSNIYFFNNHGGMPSSFYELELVDIDRNLVSHYFFRIKS